jgi:hypothetical protein
VHNLSSVERLRAVAGPGGNRPLQAPPPTGSAGVADDAEGDHSDDDEAEARARDLTGSPPPSPADVAAAAAAATGEWARDAPLAVARHALAVAVAPGRGVSNGTGAVLPTRVYAVGGWCFGSEGSALMERLDCGHLSKSSSSSSSPSSPSLSSSTASTWLRCASMAQARRLHAACFCAANGCVYVFGGSADGLPDLASVEKCVHRAPPPPLSPEQAPSLIGGAVSSQNPHPPSHIPFAPALARPPLSRPGTTPRRTPGRPARLCPRAPAVRPRAPATATYSWPFTRGAW